MQSAVLPHHCPIPPPTPLYSLVAMVAEATVAVATGVETAMSVVTTAAATMAAAATVVVATVAAAAVMTAVGVMRMAVTKA